MTAESGETTPSAAASRFASSGAVVGVLYMIGFSVIAPGLDVFAKFAAASVPVAVVVFARFAVQTVLLGVVAGVRRRPMPALRDLPLHGLRGMTIAGATLFFFAALKHMPIADAIAIFFVEPMLVILLSAIVLGEKAGMRRYIGCGVGFFGALLVIQPSFENVGVPALYPLGTAACFAVYLLLTRSLSQRTDVVTLQLLAGLAGGAVIGVALWIGEGTGSATFDPRWPQGTEWGLLFGVGLCATLSHLLIVMALRHAPASVVAPVQYLEIASASIYGFWFFGDLPDAIAWVGIAIVVGSGLYVLHRERVAQKQAWRIKAGPPAP